MVNELSAVLLDSVANSVGGVVANSVGGIVAPVDVKVAATVAVWGPTHAGRTRIFVSIM